MKFSLAGLVLVVCGAASAIGMESGSAQRIVLPEPRQESEVSVEAALAARRSVRDYVAQPLPITAIGQLLWAAQGISSAAGKRTAPSAGALYPLEIYLVAGQVEKLVPGVYRYRPRRHTLVLHRSGDLRQKLARAAVRQQWIADGAAVFVIVGVIQRTARKYGSRAQRYVHIEVGHAAQNIYLQAGALGLGTVMVGAFQDEAVQEILGLPADEAPLALMPIGRPE